jgi:hypothetical protein
MGNARAWKIPLQLVEDEDYQLRHVGDDAPAGQALAKRGEGSLDLRPAEQNVIRRGHAASRSLTDR